MTTVRNMVHGNPITNFSFFEKEEKGEGFYYKNQEYIHHSQLSYKETAFHRFSRKQLIFLSFFGVFLTLAFLFNWHATIITIFSLLTVMYFMDLLFNLFLITRSFSATDIDITDKEIAATTDWPTYTILCPLYNEWKVLPQFISAMTDMEYPKEKLQVMLLLEEDDTESLEHIQKMDLPEFFTTVIVPHSRPKTKPKACNYGLTKATGEYIVIYDAEDIPDVLQLKKAVLAFKTGDPKLVCIQAKLNFYNPHQNLLSRVFTAEYSLWFEMILTGLQSINAPIPLGGTSNHFKTSDLIALKGWDSFNVTEDCDLGMRLVKKGYRTAILDSLTLEEANSSPKNWFAQRTRWIKGYMQTYLLHMRRPHDFGNTWREPHLLTFQLIVGGKVLSMFINPLLWVTTILYFLYRANIGTFIESLFPGPILYIGAFSLFMGNFLYLYYYMIGAARHGHHGLVKYTFLVPFYWLAMSIAAWKASYELIVSPHYWSKTKHGLHLTDTLIPSNLLSPMKVTVV